MKLRHLATLYLVLLQIDSADSQQLLEKLRSARVGSNPWEPLAAELMALIAYKSGDFEQARAIYKDLDNNKVSGNIAFRAKIMASRLPSTK